MLITYALYNRFIDKDIGVMKYDHSTNKGTIDIFNLENSSFWFKLFVPSGHCDEDLTDKWIKRRVEPPDRQEIGYYMEKASGYAGASYNPYTLFFWHEGRHSSDYLEIRKEDNN